MQTNNQCQEHLTFYSPNTKLCSISNLGWSFDKSKQRANSFFLYFGIKLSKRAPWHHVYSTTMALAVAKL